VPSTPADLLATPRTPAHTLPPAPLLHPPAAHVCTVPQGAALVEASVPLYASGTDKCEFKLRTEADSAPHSVVDSLFTSASIQTHLVVEGS